MPEAPLYTRTFWLACAIHFTGAMSHGMFLLLPLYVRALGGDELTIGLVLGAGFGTSVALRPAVGALLDRLGRRRVLLGAALTSAATLPPFLLLRSAGPALFVLAAAHLAATGALFAGYFTYATDIVPAARRAEGLAIFGVAGIAPNGIGPALGEALIAGAGYAAFFWTAAGFALVSSALTALAPERRGAAAAAAAAAEGTGSALPTLARGGVPRVLAVTVFFGAGVNAAFFFLAPFTRELGISRAAPFFAAYAATTVAVRVAGRRLPDRLGAHRLAVPAFAVFALGLGGLALLPAPGVLVLAGMACGLGHGTLFPVLGALAVTRTPPRLHGTVMSLYTGALDLGAVVGTPACGAIALVAGYPAMFVSMAGAALLGLGLMATDRREA